MHCQANFPHRKASSDLDVGLPRGVTDSEYLRVVDENLRAVLQSFEPDLVLYDAGVDVHRSDALGFLELSDQGIYDRELLVRARDSSVLCLSRTRACGERGHDNMLWVTQVLETCLEHRVPVAGNVGGGYSSDLDTLAWRHCMLHMAATAAYNKHLRRPTQLCMGGTASHDTCH